MVLEIAPHSLFGKHSYPTEQALIMKSLMEIEDAIVLVKPMAVGMPFPLERLPFEMRRKKVSEHLSRAKKLLDELM
jgi:hypothetical protein